jgi:predicted acylesterase/phospholipase RssA
MKYLVIGPGAMAFFMYLGVLSRFKKEGRLTDLEEISGASAGAMLGLFYCMSKGDTTKVLDYSLGAPVKNVMKPNLKSLLTNYGLIPASKIREVFSEACSCFMGAPDAPS